MVAAGTVLDVKIVKMVLVTAAVTAVTLIFVVIKFQDQTLADSQA